MSKRIIDVVGASLGLLLTLPFFAVISAAIKLTSKGPVFYRGLRTGLNGKPFGIFKFRTMVIDAEKLGGPSTALNDPRITPIGKFLRRYKLDEFPQLINILKGEMSFVGPRPQVERYTKLYKGEEAIILSVRPGLTDYASLHFINMDSTLGDSDVDQKYLTEVEPLKNTLRIKYVKEQSFMTDMKILLKTLVRIFQA
jgi:lipopolysaccharide/colanic/teichoic acid biosynthesis glycosyltransferase